jgi:hypothetical protein
MGKKKLPAMRKIVKRRAARMPRRSTAPAFFFAELIEPAPIA